jgi:hypothetical protein
MRRSRLVQLGRGRVPARREQVCDVKLAKRWIWSVLGFGKDGSRGRDPSRGSTHTLLSSVFLRTILKPSVFLSECQQDLSRRTISLFGNDEFGFPSAPLLLLLIGCVVLGSH